MVDCLDTVSALLGVAAVLGFALVSLFRFGTRTGAWFSSLEADDRRLYLAALALSGWTVALAVVAWGMSFLVYVVYIREQPGTPAAWAGAASVALLLAVPVVALLAGIPWLAMVAAVRVLRWRWRGSVGRHSDGG